jgi:undecaprenyl-phosphate 4-deoxy-4-formamido-L-arabinose transferase
MSSIVTKTESSQDSQCGPLEVSVVVPVYNSAMVLPRLINELEAALRTCCDKFEVILVNDASRDQSWEAIRQLSQQYSWVHGCNLMRNSGQHNALLCGIRAAKYDLLVTIDDDLQNPPHEIPNLLEKLAGERLDVVYGVPEQQQHGLLRNLASRVTKIVLQNAMGAEIAENISAFRVFRTGVRDAFNNYRGPFVSIDVLLTWGTTRFGSVRVSHAPRREGTSGYSVRLLIAHALNMMTGFSVIPLQIASIIGFTFTIFGIGTLTYVIAMYLLHGSPVQGFPFLASIIAIFSGAQLFSLGIMGEYLARMHFRMMDRPAYTLRDTTPDTER